SGGDGDHAKSSSEEAEQNGALADNSVHAADGWRENRVTRLLRVVLDPARVLLAVGRAVLHHDAVAGEVAAGPVALEHNRDAGAEQLGRIAIVYDAYAHALLGDSEARGVVHGAGLVDDRALDAEPARAQGLLLGDRFVGGLEVERRRAEALHREEPEHR